MTNFEKYKEKIIGIFKSDSDVAIVNNKPTLCTDISDCWECDLYDDNAHCIEKFAIWLETEYVEPEIDWSKVPVDTKVLVRGSEANSEWVPRHFKKFENGHVYTWPNGLTSWTAANDGYDIEWLHAKLPEEYEEENNNR